MIAPLQSNHTLIIAYVNFLTIVAGGIYLVGRYSIRFKSSSIDYRIILFSLLQYTVPIVYFWAFFHKLNTAFIDPQVSCAVEFYTDTSTRYDFLPFPHNLFTYQLVIYMTLIVEGALSVLFLNPRTRFLGIIIGMLFHAFLGLTYFRDFSTLMIALYLIYLSEHFPIVIKQYIEKLPDWLSRQWLWHTMWACIVGVLVTSLPGVARFTYRLTPSIAIFLLLIAIAFIALLLFLVYEWRNKQTFQFRSIIVYRPLILVFALILFLNGATPYIGLKTDLAFDMYSNVLIEGESNHLLLRANTQLFDYSNDLVQVIDSEPVWIAEIYGEQQIKLPFIQFREIWWSPLTVLVE